jgi:hypothetical protein
MFGDGSLTLREFAMREPLPLARIQEAVLEFLRHRQDAVLFGAQAVNAYVDEPRMTQDVDILSPRAAGLADELRSYLAALFHIAVRVRVVAGGNGFRIFQLREPKNRHLADIRQATAEIPTRLVADIRVPEPEELIAQKMISLTRRRGQPKSDTDLRDVKLLLLSFPVLQQAAGAVRERLDAAGAETAVLVAWEQLAGTVIQSSPEEDEGD